MSFEQSKEDKILACWHQNAAAWSTAISEHQVDSRNLVTNQAVVDAVLRSSPKTTIDIGCGEGWLVRHLLNEGVDTTGIDAVAELIDSAKRHDVGNYKLMNYEDIQAEQFASKVDVVVCNFSLIGKDSVEHVFSKVPSLLNKSGEFIVQTLNPSEACGDEAYKDGWRQGSWQGFDEAFVNPAPWYFRTEESWRELFRRSGFTRLEVNEPLHPHTGRAASTVFVATIN